MWVCESLWEPQLTSRSSLTSSHLIRHAVPAGPVHSGHRGGCWTCDPRAVHWAGWDLCEGWQGCWVEGNSQVRLSSGSCWQQCLAIKLLTARQLYSCNVMKREYWLHLKLSGSFFGWFVQDEKLRGATKKQCCDLVHAGQMPHLSFTCLCQTFPSYLWYLWEEIV